MPAFAQDDLVPEGIRVFEPGYFDEFDPVNVLEMVFRMPGFSPQQRDGGRGLSDVRTNVLINGERPPPKGQSFFQQLGEMPVSRVESIELIDAGARLDIDMQSYPQVINIVTIPDAPAYYEVISEVQRSGTGDFDQGNERDARIESTGSFSLGAHEFTMRGNYSDRTNQPPASLISIDPANPQQRFSSVNRSENTDYGFDFNALLAVGDDSSLSFNGQYSTEDSISFPVLPDGAVQSADAVDRSSSGAEDQYDIAAEYRRPAGARGTLMFAVVNERSNDQSQSTFASAGLDRLSLNDREGGETALRLLVTRNPTNRVTLRTTATMAFNYFEGDFRLFENGVEQSIEGSANRVEEDRETIEAAVDWNPGERWTITGSFGIEQYDIRSSDAASGNQTDPISTVSVSYRPRARTTWTLESERDIGQLSFNQFLASSNLSSEILTAGASALEPVRSTSNRLRYDRRFADVGVMRFTLSHNKTHNPVRRVALSDELVISQNTSPQTSDSVSADVQYPFSRFGREDLILGFEAQIADSETIDPVTGQLRQVSGDLIRYWSLELRRDPGDGPLSWGMSVQKFTRNEDYSVRSISSNRNSEEWDAWVEWEAVPDLRIRASLNGPRDWQSLEYLYPGVRTPGLEPSFLTLSESWRDRTPSLSIEWRRRDHIEISGSISARPSNRTVETLMPYGGIAGDPFVRYVATTPRATFRVRVYR